MGEENSPNKDDHKSVVVEKKYISTQQNSQVVDVTKVVESSANGSGSNTTLIIIIAIVVVLIAAGAIIFVKKKDEKRTKLRTIMQCRTTQMRINKTDKYLYRKIFIIQAKYTKLRLQFCVFFCFKLSEKDCNFENFVI